MRTTATTTSGMNDPRTATSSSASENNAVPGLNPRSVSIGDLSMYIQVLHVSISSVLTQY